jgi:hypothetical protein
MKTEQSVPKRRHVKFRCRGITRKKTYNIQNTAKVWNQEIPCITAKNDSIIGEFLKPQTYVKPEAAITVFELLMMNGVSLETRWAINKHWNNKFYYTVASCWLFL